MYQKDNKLTRTLRTRAKIARFSNRPRLVITRSNKHISAQIVDDNGKSLVNASDLGIAEKLTKTQKATQVGTDIAKKALAKKIDNVVLDRGPYKYHGRIKALTEAARAAKLTI